MFLATEEHASSETQAREYVGSESNTYYVVVTGADHMSFTDAHLVSSRFARDSKPDYRKAASAPGLDVIVRIDKK